MSQILSQALGQHMRLEQKLTPQLIQSMDILQLSTPALENRIAEELERNVTLEIPDAAPATGDNENRGEAEFDGHQPTEDSASFNRLDRMSREYGLDSDDRLRERRTGRPYGADQRDAKVDAMANTASRTAGLDEYLLQQWALLDIDDQTRRAGEAIIYQLEEDGYLKTPLEQIAADSRPPLSVESLETALRHVQRLDPVGIAARDYRECLLLQLDALEGDNTIERTLIQNHLDDIGRNRFPAIAKETGYTTGEIAEAVEAIKHSLVLHPGHLVVDKRVPRVYPDVIIEEDAGGKGLIIRLARGNLPDLRIKQEYLDMLKAKSNGKELRDFVRKHVEGASALIEAIKFRRSRLMEVAEAVVRHQAEFFEIGPPGLKVFRMSDLAEEIGCDPSTISRTVADKYLETPHGVFPLRYFFTGGTDSGDGAAGTSWDSIKQRVADIVKNEDPGNPLNDDQIAEVLAKEDIQIKRRTVAKYRAQLDIPPARQRRKF